jgi:ribosomal protein L37AE/L43A
MNNEEFLVKMKSDCPNLYKNLDYIECDEGWQFLLEQLSYTLESEIQFLIESDPSMLDKIYVTQIKEKFGTLRFYMSRNTLFTDGAIRLAEHISSSTCELCGSTSAKNRSIGNWFKVYCDQCSKKMENRSRNPSTNGI